jgi:hypothetical protein
MGDSNSGAKVEARGNGGGNSGKGEDGRGNSGGRSKGGGGSYGGEAEVVAALPRVRG